MLGSIYFQRHEPSRANGNSKLQRCDDDKLTFKTANVLNHLDRKDKQRVFRVIKQIHSSLKPKIPN